MKDLVKKADLEAQFHIESAATSAVQTGNPVCTPAHRKLAEHGISCAGKTARQLTEADYGRYDLLIGMDWANLQDMCRVCGGDPDGKIQLLMELPAAPAMLPNRGTWATLKPLGQMCWRSVRDCYERCAAVI